VGVLNVTTTLEILEKLVAFDTTSARPNLELIDYVRGFLETRGFIVHILPNETGAKAGIYAQIGPAGQGVLLSGHSDVVPVTGQGWNYDPFKLTRVDDRVYGRGTTDMKGYVASMLSLADRASRISLKEPLKLALSYDEEVGCVGIQHMIGDLERTIGLPRACFVGEPTQMAVAIGHKGKAALRANIHGQAGHSALAPNFVNALHLATDFTLELRKIQEGLIVNGAHDAHYDIPYSTIHVGKLSGGTALNIVPDFAQMDFEYRHLAADRPNDILRQVLDAARRVEERYKTQDSDASIAINQYNAYPGFNVESDADIVVFGKRLAQTNSIKKVAFGTEAGFFDGLGIPTVVCGPGSMEGQGHKADEYLTLSQLNACDTLMERLLDEMTA
jgi:acetylornithine deacetylase